MAILSISHIGASVAGGWFGGQLAPNGCIYGVPGNSDAVLKIDPTTDTVTTFGSVAAVTGITTPQNSYFDGVLVGTDIYCVPHDGGIYPNQPVLVIHTSTDTLLDNVSLGLGALTSWTVPFHDGDCAIIAAGARGLTRPSQ